MEVLPTSPPPPPPSDQLRSFAEIPERYRGVFSAYSCFNAIQSRVLDDVFRCNDSLVVAAPTGSGKTAVFEMAIIKLLSDMAESCTAFKMVYVSPVKALCRERYEDWAPRFSPLGVTCVEVTGDGGDFFELQPYNLIITTPEKFDSLTRRWRDSAGLVQLVRLLMVDEVHLLNDGKRGPVLEAIVCRMKTVAATLKTAPVRFLAVSATIYNVEDLAAWLGTPAAPAHCHKFGNEVRPVQLTKVVRGYHSAASQSPFLFDIQLSFKLKPLILEHAKGRPVLIFCSTRKGVAQTAKTLSEQLTFHFSEAQRSRLSDGAWDLADRRLKETVLLGVGHHHAGLSVGDRRLVQDLFARGALPVLVATSTLAMGVNLPAHLVIIKGTQQYVAGTVEEYSESAILQMIGRAGRPQFDTTATAVIMTKDRMVERYKRLLESKEVVESNLHHRLAEHLNSEVVLYTITDLSVAMEWIRFTFLYVRAMRHPKHYGLEATATPARVEKHLETIVLREINALKKAELISMSDNGLDIAPTATGRLMSYYYLSFETFKVFLALKANQTVSGLLSAMSEAREFADIQLRVNERKYLNELNRSKNRECIRFPLVGKIKTREMKVNCLLQATLGCLHIQDPALLQEAARIATIAERLVKCLAEFLSGRPCFQTLFNAKLLAKCLHARMWEHLPYMSRQLDRIGPTLASLLAACGKTSFDAIEASNPRDLERILNRAPPFGNYLQDAVLHLPKYDLAVSLERSDASTYLVTVTVALCNGEVLAERSTAGPQHWLTLLVGDTNNRVLSHKRLSDQSLMSKPLVTTVTCKFPDWPHKVEAHLLSEQWIGIDVRNEVVVAEPAGGGKEAPSLPPKEPKSPYWTAAGSSKSTTLRNFNFSVEYSKQNSNKTDAEKMIERTEALGTEQGKSVDNPEKMKLNQISTEEHINENSVKPLKTVEPCSRQGKLQLSQLMKRISTEGTNKENSVESDHITENAKFSQPMKKIFVQETIKMNSIESEYKAKRSRVDEGIRMLESPAMQSSPLGNRKRGEVTCCFDIDVVVEDDSPRPQDTEDHTGRETWLKPPPSPSATSRVPQDAGTVTQSKENVPEKPLLSWEEIHERLKARRAPNPGSWKEEIAGNTKTTVKEERMDVMRGGVGRRAPAAGGMMSCFDVDIHEVVGAQDRRRAPMASLDHYPLRQSSQVPKSNPERVLTWGDVYEDQVVNMGGEVSGRVAGTICSGVEMAWLQSRSQL